MEEKTKKPFYKKWWVWLIVVIIVVAAATGGEEDEAQVEDVEGSEESTSDVEENDAEDETEPTEDSNEEEESEESNESETEESEEVEETEESEANEEEIIEEESEEISAGTYKIGDDLPAGEYLVIADGMAYIESASDSSGELDSIIFNLNLSSGAHSYVTVNEGEYLKFQRAVAYPVESAPSVVPEDGVYTDGMYKVGEDIPAGEYKVILNDSAAAGMGYLEVSSDSSHQLGSIATNENVQADTYITVNEGQFLTLQDLTIETE